MFKYFYWGDLLEYIEQGAVLLKLSQFHGRVFLFFLSEHEKINNFIRSQGSIWDWGDKTNIIKRKFGQFGFLDMASLVSLIMLNLNYVPFEKIAMVRNGDW
jgi:hypothetical protein